MKSMLVLLVLALGACCPAPVAPQVEQADLQAAPSLCKRECAALTKLACDEAKPTRGGESCEDVCVAAANVGSFPPAACVEKATTCKAASACRTVR